QEYFLDTGRPGGHADLDASGAHRANAVGNVLGWLGFADEVEYEVVVGGRDVVFGTVVGVAPVGHPSLRETDRKFNCLRRCLTWGINRRLTGSSFVSMWMHIRRLVGRSWWQS